MVPERLAPDDPREWLNRAKSNLARAKAGNDIPGVYLEDLCFDAQQAAEKAIKAALLHQDVSSLTRTIWRSSSLLLNVAGNLCQRL